jgi:hypothetical protein
MQERKGSYSKRINNQNPTEIYIGFVDKYFIIRKDQWFAGINEEKKEKKGR